MDKLTKKNKITIGGFAVCTLAISASTLNMYDFLKGESQAERLLALGWLTLVIGYKRMLNE